MSKIRGPGGGQTPPPTTENNPPTNKASQTSKDLKPVHSDGFEQRTAQVGSPIPTQLTQQLKSTTGKIQFSNEDYAYLAQTFANIINQNPGADRQKRARLFSKAILKRKHLRKLLSGLSEAQTDQLADEIGDLLSDSPYFGELIEEASRGAQKLSAGG